MRRRATATAKRRNGAHRIVVRTPVYGVDAPVVQWGLTAHGVDGSQGWVGKLLRLPEKLTSIELVDSGLRIVKLRGDLDLVTAASVSEVLSQGFDVLDFSELAFLDSSGLRVLLQSCRDRPTRPIARGLSGQVRRILGLTGLLEMFDVEDDEHPESAEPSSLT